MVRVLFSPATKGTYSKEVEIPASELGLPGANAPTLVDQDNVTLYKFAVDTDVLTYELEPPEDYAGGDINIMVMWTNDGGVDDNGKNVKWQIDYQTSDAGDPISGNHANSPKTVEDAYTSDAGWIEHHTAPMVIAAADFSGKHHILLKISAVAAPAVVLTCDPHLICVCYSYTAKWGRKP